MNLSGKIINDYYMIREKISEDSLCTFWKANGIFSAQEVLLRVFIKSNSQYSEDDLVAFKESLMATFDLSQENIPSLLEIDQFEGHTYIATDFIRGIRLSDFMVNKEVISPGEAIDIVLGLCRGLKALHKRELALGYLDPEEILIEPYDENKSHVNILNLGYYNLRKNSNGEELRNFKKFVSPKINSVDKKKSDLYSLGLIFYLLLTNDNELKLDSKNSIEKKLFETSLKDEKDKDSFLNIILKLLDKDKDNTYEDVSEVFEELEELQESHIRSKVEDTVFDKRDHYYRKDEKRKAVEEREVVERMLYFQKLEEDRQRYFEKIFEKSIKSDYFEKSQRDYKKYLEKLSEERTRYFQNLSDSSKEYFQKIMEEQADNLNALLKNRKTYLDSISNKTKEYFDTLNKQEKKYFSEILKTLRSRVDDNKGNLEHTLIAEELKSEAAKYFINLTKEEKKIYKRNQDIKDLYSGKKGDRKIISRLEKQNKDIEKIILETKKYYEKTSGKKIDNFKEILDEIDKTIKLDDTASIQNEKDAAKFELQRKKLDKILKIAEAQGEDEEIKEKYNALLALLAGSKKITLEILKRIRELIELLLKKIMNKSDK